MTKCEFLCGCVYDRKDIKYDRTFVLLCPVHGKRVKTFFRVCEGCGEEFELTKYQISRKLKCNSCKKAALMEWQQKRNEKKRKGKPRPKNAWITLASYDEKKQMRKFRRNRGGEFWKVQAVKKFYNAREFANAAMVNHQILIDL